MASTVCPPVVGRAGSAHDGLATPNVTSFANIDQALSKDNEVKSAARTLPRSRLDRLTITSTPIEGVANERFRSRPHSS